MNSIQKATLSLSALLLSLGTATSAMAFSGGTTPDYPMGCMYLLDGVDNYGTGFYYEEFQDVVLQTVYNTTVDLGGDFNDEISAILVPPGCHAQVWQHANENPAGWTQHFPPGFYDITGGSLNDQITGISCSCQDLPTQHAVLFSSNTRSHASAPSGTWFSGGDFSITAWVNPSSAANYARLLDFGNGPASNNVLLATSVGTTGIPRLGIYKNGVETTLNAPWALPLNEWTHITVTYSASTTTANMYFNGDLVATTSTMQAPSNVTRSYNYIGKSNWTQDATFLGSIADVRIFDSYALNEGEIHAIVAGKDYPSDNVWTYEKAHYQMMSGTTWYDASINRKDATLVYLY